MSWLSRIVTRMRCQPNFVWTWKSTSWSSARDATPNSAGPMTSLSGVVSAKTRSSNGLAIFPLTHSPKAPPRLRDGHLENCLASVPKYTAGSSLAASSAFSSRACPSVLTRMCATTVDVHARLIQNRAAPARALGWMGSSSAETRATQSTDVSRSILLLPPIIVGRRVNTASWAFLDVVCRRDTKIMMPAGVVSWGRRWG